MSSDISNKFSVGQKLTWFSGIQELRGLLIALIILSHASDFLIVRSKGVWGAAGVTGFFMISGFLIPEGMKSTDAKVRCGIENVLKTIRNIFSIFDLSNGGSFY